MSKRSQRSASNTSSDMYTPWWNSIEIQLCLLQVSLESIDAKIDCSHTNPGLQKPHWVPWCRTKASCSGDNPVFSDPNPSTVVTESPSIKIKGRRHELIGLDEPKLSGSNFCTKFLILGKEDDDEDGVERITVHAPHPPCLHGSWSPFNDKWSRK